MDKIKTPFWDLKQWKDDVYEPSEDSFLLLDSLEEDLSLIRSLGPIGVVEIGSGSGIVITALSLALGRDAAYTAIDINPKACLATQHTSTINSAHVNVLCSDLVESLRLDRWVDLLVFNPPYVPSHEEEETGIIDKAWAGSNKGRSTTDRLFPQLSKLMSRKCLGYIVSIEENSPSEMCRILESFGFQAAVVKKRKIIGEKLSIIRFMRGF